MTFIKKQDLISDFRTFLGLPFIAQSPKNSQLIKDIIAALRRAPDTIVDGKELTDIFLILAKQINRNAESELKLNSGRRSQRLR